MSAISEIEKYLEEQNSKRANINKRIRVALLLFLVSVIVFIYFRRPEPKQIEVMFINAEEELYVTVLMNENLGDVLENMDLSSSNIYYVNDEIVTYKELQKMKVKTELEITYVVVFVEESITTEEIVFEIEKIDDDTLYVGNEKIVKNGKHGEKEIHTIVTYHDGIEVSREITETVTFSPVTEVVAIGTKTYSQPSSTSGSGVESNNSSNSSDKVETSSTPNNDLPKEDSNEQTENEEVDSKECIITVNGVEYPC